MNQIITSSIDAQQRKMQTIFNNIANASNPAYTQKVTNLATKSSGGQAQGVSVLAEVRVGDPLRTEDVRVKTIEVNYLETLDGFHTELQRRLGQPGDQGSLGAKMANLTIALGKMQDAPGTPGHQNDVLGVFQDTVKYVNNLGKFFQDQRLEAENGIQDAVKNVNRVLGDLQTINGDIAIASGRGSTTGTLEDKQDALLKELSQYMDIQVMRRDNLSLDITTNIGQGLLLTDGAKQLSFTKSTSIGPSDTAATLGKITVGTQDLTSSISSGKIGAFIKARDSIFPDMQAELDEFTEKFRDQLNAVHNQGTGFPVPQTLTGVRTFATPAVTEMQMSGVVRIGVVDNATGDFVALPCNLDLTGGSTIINTVIGQINTALGVNGTAALNGTNQLVITATNANHGIAIVSMTDPEAVEATSGLGFSHHFGLNDLFVTGSRFIQDGNPSKIGLTQSLALRVDINGNAGFLARGKISTADFAAHPNAIQPGDGRIVSQMMSIFDKAVSFETAGTMSARSESLINYSNSVWHNASVDAKNNKSHFEIQNSILEESVTDLQSRTRVNIHEQIADLMEAQRIYAVSTRLLQASKEMLDQLMRI